MLADPWFATVKENRQGVYAWCAACATEFPNVVIWTSFREWLDGCVMRKGRPQGNPRIEEPQDRPSVTREGA